ncbi:MAG: hypothetical protein GY801_32690, partial [bacterium]|nr:hypothetical protein [bacterium]
AENIGSGSEPKYSYTGKERDSSGLMYYGARYYDPALSRFITPDTLYDRGPQGLNRYSYALNNPIRYNDPSGHFINGPDDDQNPTCDGCVTGSPENGGEDMVYHENFDDPSHLDVGYTPRWPHRIASMSDDVIIPIPHRGDELWVDPASAVEQTVSKIVRKVAKTTGDYAGTLLGRDDNVFTGERIAASTKHAVIMDVITTAAFFGISKIGPAGGVIKASKSSTALIRKTNLPVKYDPEFAAKQILGQDPVTPGGRTIMDHAARRMMMPPKGRTPMTIQEVDLVLDTGTKVRKITPHPAGTTVTIQHPKMPGKPQVIVDADTGKRVITVIKNRVKRK